METGNSADCALCDEIIRMAEGTTILSYTQSRKIINMVRKMAQNPCPAGKTTDQSVPLSKDSNVHNYNVNANKNL